MTRRPRSKFDTGFGLVDNLGMFTSITDTYQVTLPAEIVDGLALVPGTRLEWRIGPDGTIVATPRPSRATLASAFLGSGRRLLKPGEDPIAELITERAKTVDGDHRES